MAQKQFQDNRMNPHTPKAKSGLIPEGSGAAGFIKPREPGEPTGLMAERSQDRFTPPPALKGWTSDKPSVIEMPGYALARAARG